MFSRPDDLPGTVAAFRQSENTSALQEFVVGLVGPQTFGLGVIYGMGENVAGSMISVAQLVKTLLLADLYDRANQPALMAVGPLAPFQHLVATLSMRQVRRELEEAREERDALIAELTYAVMHPREVFGQIGADYAVKWRRFEDLSTQRTLTAQFEAGRIVGEVLMDLLAVIGTGVVVVKTAAKIPRVLKLAKGPRKFDVRGEASSVKVSPPPSEAPVTPSQLRAREPEAPVTGERTVAPARSVPETPEAPLKGKSVRLEGMTSKEIQYTKRTKAEREALRKEFEPRIRKSFVKGLLDDPAKVEALKKAGITESDLAGMRDGIAPTGYQVHHKLPLDDGGTNAMDNLILMKNDPYHRALTNLQNDFTRALPEGQSKTVSWPVPDGFMYPAQ